jgi:hypothetical protein
LLRAAGADRSFLTDGENSSIAIGAAAPTGGGKILEAIETERRFLQPALRRNAWGISGRR